MDYNLVIEKGGRGEGGVKGGQRLENTPSPKQTSPGGLGGCGGAGAGAGAGLGAARGWEGGRAGGASMGAMAAAEVADVRGVDLGLLVVLVLGVLVALLDARLALLS